MELSSPRLENFLYFFLTKTCSEKVSLYFLEKKNFYISGKIELSSSNIKKFLIFFYIPPPPPLYFRKRETLKSFFCFRK